MALVDISVESDFQSLIKSGRPVVAHFWASWCDPCSQMDVVLRQLSAENTHAAFVRVEAEELPGLSEKYSVATVPLFLFFKGGELVDRLEGANAPELAHKVATHISGPGAALGSSSGVGATASTGEVINSLQATLGASPGGTPGTFPIPTQPLLNSRHAAAAPTEAEAKPGLSPELQRQLRELVASHPVMLFMKGTPEAPRCGFSSKVVGMLRDVGAQFGSFDILADDAVRQGLKLLSDWPTFPQLYVGGELLGGCDIVAEMHRSGELQKTVAKATGVGAHGPAGATCSGSNSRQEDGADATDAGAEESRLQALVSSAPVMLFMKGTPEAPQCGFSRRVVEALQEEGVQFGSFDILSDEAVRQGLKDFSNWPTYPQLYHKGELVGGCDIVMEMRKTGELRSTLS